MKLFASVCAGTVMAAGITAPARAQVIQAQIIQIADVIRGDDGAYRDAYPMQPDATPTEPVPMGDDVVLAPEEIPGILRQQGFSQLGPVFRRGWVYTVAALNQDGDDGRLIVDARSGEPIRFIPAMRMDTRLRDELDRMYGPPGPPPARFARDPRDSYGAAALPRREYPPHVAGDDAPPSPPHHAAQLRRAAKAAPKSNPVTIATAPAKPQAAPAPANAHTAQLSGAVPTAKEPEKVEAKPEAGPATDASGVELKPTGPMPPVQPMD